METFYLIDFENVNSKDLKNIDILTESDQVHIFYTDNSPNISLDIVFAEGIKIVPHKIPVGKQSVDMHLVSYLGYLLGKDNNKACSYIIISKDTDYDNIIEFWKGEGFKVSKEKKISKDRKISGDNAANQKNAKISLTASSKQAENGETNDYITNEFSSSDRCKLNTYMQRGLVGLGYSSNMANRICKCVVAHCNDERMLSEIHNELRVEFADENYSEIYNDIKEIFKQFVSSKNKDVKRELQVHSFFSQHFKKKIYVDKKEEIIQIILEAKTRQQVNNELQKLFSDNSRVKEVIRILKPLIKDFPGK